VILGCDKKEFLAFWLFWHAIGGKTAKELKAVGK